MHACTPLSRDSLLLISICTWAHLCFPPAARFHPAPLPCRGTSTIATSWLTSSLICTRSDRVKALATILLKLMCLYLCSALMIAVSEDWLMLTWWGQCFWLLRHPCNWGYWVAVADWLALVLLVKHTLCEGPRLHRVYFECLMSTWLSVFVQ